MRCPFCHHQETRVIDSRQVSTGESIRRRRECDRCSKRFTTFETIEKAQQTVIKRNGKRVPYQREQLLRGIDKACRKRPVPSRDIQEIVDYIEREVFNGPDKEVTSEHLGELVLKRLKEIDKVAYLRFASVYKDFHDLNDFNDEIKALMRRPSGTHHPSFKES